MQFFFLLSNFVFGKSVNFLGYEALFDKIDLEFRRFCSLKINFVGSKKTFYDFHWLLVLVGVLII